MESSVCWYSDRNPSLSMRASSQRTASWLLVWPGRRVPSTWATFLMAMVAWLLGHSWTIAKSHWASWAGLPRAAATVLAMRLSMSRNLGTLLACCRPGSIHLSAGVTARMSFALALAASFTSATKPSGSARWSKPGTGVSALLVSSTSMA